jgi:hypothetical protein
VDELVRRKELLCVRRLRYSYRKRFVVGVVLMSMERKRVEEGWKKIGRRIEVRDRRENPYLNAQLKSL